jgi:hypothetical protein
MSEPRKRHQMPIAYEKGPGASEKSICETRESIKVKVAMHIYAQMVGQKVRANQGFGPELAEKAFDCARDFIQAWDKSSYVE